MGFGEAKYLCYFIAKNQQMFVLSEAVWVVYISFPTNVLPLRGSCIVVWTLGKE